MCFYSCYAISNEAPMNQLLYSYHAYGLKEIA